MMRGTLRQRGSKTGTGPPFAPVWVSIGVTLVIVLLLLGSLLKHVILVLVLWIYYLFLEMMLVLAVVKVSLLMFP